MCEHCASGCALRTDHRRGKVTRRLAGNDPEVNEEWNCDKGRFGFMYARQPDRLTHPLVRDEERRAAPGVVAGGVRRRRPRPGRGAGSVGVLTGGRLTAEDAYAYAKFARVALGTNDIDFRARPHSAEEADFLASTWPAPASGSPTPTWRTRPAVVLVGFEPEDESPIVFLRLRKAAAQGAPKVFSVAPFTSRGLQKMHGTLIRTAPGAEAAALEALAARRRGRPRRRRRDPGRRADGRRRPVRCPRSSALAAYDRRPAGLGAPPCR